MTSPRLLAATLATSFALSAAPAPASAASFLETLNTTVSTTVDLVLLRPLGVGRLVFGAGVAMPFSSTLNLLGLPLGQDPKVFVEDWDRYGVEPAEYTFQRRVGKDLPGL